MFGLGLAVLSMGMDRRSVDGDPEEMEEVVVRRDTQYGPMYYKRWRKKKEVIHCKPEGTVERWKNRNQLDDVDPVADGYHRGHE